MCRNNQLLGVFLCGLGLGLLCACFCETGFFLGCVGIGAIIGGILLLSKC